MELFPLVLVVVGFAFVASEFQSKPTNGFQDSLIEETSDEANARHGYQLKPANGFQDSLIEETSDEANARHGYQLKPANGFQDSLIEETSDDSNARHGYHCYTVSFKRTSKPYYTLAVP